MWKSLQVHFKLSQILTRRKLWESRLKIESTFSTWLISKPCSLALGHPPFPLPLSPYFSFSKFPSRGRASSAAFLPHFRSPSLFIMRMCRVCFPLPVPRSDGLAKGCAHYACAIPTTPLCRRPRKRFLPTRPFLPLRSLALCLSRPAGPLLHGPVCQHSFGSRPVRPGHAPTLRSSSLSLILGFSTPPGRLSMMSFVLNALTCALGLLYFIRRGKQCLDFTVTVHFFHLLGCWFYSSRFPSALTWWLVQAVCIALMAVIGEYLCMRTELKEIPLNSAPKSNV
nr:protein SYS1 homolog isoform X2 [Microcebus murinus]